MSAIKMNNLNQCFEKNAVAKKDGAVNLIDSNLELCYGHTSLQMTCQRQHEPPLSRLVIVTLSHTPTKLLVAHFLIHGGVIIIKS